MEEVEADGVINDLLKQTTAVLPVFPPETKGELRRILKHKLDRYLADLSRGHDAKYKLSPQEEAALLEELTRDHFENGLSIRLVSEKMEEAVGGAIAVQRLGVTGANLCAVRIVGGAAKP